MIASRGPLSIVVALHLAKLREPARRFRILSMSVFTAAPPGIASARRLASGLRPPRLAARVRSPRSIRSLNGLFQDVVPPQRVGVSRGRGCLQEPTAYG